MLDLNEMRNRGAVVMTPDGEVLRVTIQYLPNLLEPSNASRAERIPRWKAALEAAFEPLKPKLAAVGGEFETKSLLVLGQVITVRLPVSTYEGFLAELDPQLFRVDPLADVQMELC